MSRTYTTRRQGIVNALVNKLKDIDGTGFFRANVNEMQDQKLENIKEQDKDIDF